MSGANHEELVGLLRRVERALELASTLACPASAEVGKCQSLLMNASTAHLAFDQLKATVAETANKLEQDGQTGGGR